jgi:dihydroorotase
MAIGPRDALGLPCQRIEEGYVADLTVVEPTWKWTVGEEPFVSKSRNSAFMGRTLTGRARDVLIGGYFALRSGKVVV